MRELLLLTIASALFAAPQPPAFRLPSDAVPVRYKLDLTLDPAKDAFSGVVTIDLQVRQATTVVWLTGATVTVAGTFTVSVALLVTGLPPAPLTITV